MEHYDNEGIYLNRALIKELLIECFGTGEEHTSQDIYETLSEAHLHRGGTLDDPRRVRSRIRGALRALANEGMAENTGRGRWIIYSPEATDPSETSSIAINRNRGIVDGLVDFFERLNTDLLEPGLIPEELPDGGAELIESILDELMDNFDHEDGDDPHQKSRLDGYLSIVLTLKSISLNMSKTS